MREREIVKEKEISNDLESSNLLLASSTIDIGMFCLDRATVSGP